MYICFSVWSTASHFIRTIFWTILGDDWASDQKLMNGGGCGIMVVYFCTSKRSLYVHSGDRRQYGFVCISDEVFGGYGNRKPLFEQKRDKAAKSGTTLGRLHNLVG